MSSGRANSNTLLGLETIAGLGGNYCMAVQQSKYTAQSSVRECVLENLSVRR